MKYFHFASIHHPSCVLNLDTTISTLTTLREKKIHIWVIQ